MFSTWAALGFKPTTFTSDIRIPLLIVLWDKTKGTT